MYIGFGFAEFALHLAISETVRAPLPHMFQALIVRGILLHGEVILA